MKVNYKILDMQNKMYTKIVKGLLLIAIVFLGTINAMGQDVMTKIKDGTQQGSTRQPATGAILELESLNKGFLTPRMSTAQRDAITLTNANHGMLIFNTTTGCFNYYDANLSAGKAVWLSICGTPPPAVFHISEQQCGEIKMPKILKQGDPLTPSDFMVVGVTVQQAGTYTVLAMTNNGYYFSADGTFPATGAYTIVLSGTGTPANGYDSTTGLPGDSVEFELNGKVSTIFNCADKRVMVAPSQVSYTVNCSANKKATGDYFIGLPVTSNAIVKFFVDVTSKGQWVINTEEVNGVSFSGTGTFTDEDVSSTMEKEITLTASGTPILPGTHKYTIRANSAKDPNDAYKNQCTFEVVVKDVHLEVVCNDPNTKVLGDYKQDVKVTNDNFIDVEIDVKATGRTTFYTNKVGDLEFKTESSIAFDKLGKRTITLKAYGTPTIPGVNKFTISAKKGFLDDDNNHTENSTCVVDVNVEAQPINFNMMCNSLKVLGTYSPFATLDATKNYVEVDINVIYPGKVEISTNEVNGIKFEGGIENATIGTHKVKLNTVGTAKEGGPFKFIITTNSAGTGTKTCDFDITFLYRKMNILGLGQDLYSPGSAGPAASSRKILLTPANFGPNGVVKVQEMNIVNGAYSQDVALKNFINNSKIDIIIVGYNYTPNAQSINVLKEFVQEKKGVLIHSQENDMTGLRNLINALSENGGAVVTAAGQTYNNPLLSVDDPLLNGPFGDIRGKHGANDVNNAYYVSTVPNDFITLATSNTTSSAWLLRHKTDGFVLCGDSGWLAGNDSNNSTTTWPLAITSGGKPITKSYIDGVEVYNSLLYANTMTWAIQYVTKNTKVEHNIQ